MSKTIPSYLRIHRETEGQHADTPAETNDAIEKFWDAFSDLTGWEVERQSTLPGANLLPAALDVPTRGGERVELIGKSDVSTLADAALQLTEQLESARECIRQQEAEFASRAAVLIPDSQRVELADRLQQTLTDAATACGCDAAALYTLDDDTQFLKARSVYGLPSQRLEQPPRTLSGSRGDLEAMVQGVVTINDAAAGAIDSWNFPEPFAAGICAAIECDGIPLGTLWLFRSEPTDFGTSEAAATRLAASQLSLHLAQAASGSAEPCRAVEETMDDVAQWQFESLPIGAELADDWRVDGMIESPRSFATGWHTWDVLPDGTLMLAIAEAVDRSAAGAMHASIARAALVAHTGYKHTPGQLLQRISDTLWQTSTGEQLVSMLYARIDPETGEGEVASAGSIAALIGSSRGYRPLVDGHSDPLNTQLDARCKTETFRIGEGETLLAYTEGLAHDGATQSTLGDGVRSAMGVGDSNPLALIRRSLADLPLEHERGAVTILRTPRV